MILTSHSGARIQDPAAPPSVQLPGIDKWEIRMQLLEDLAWLVPGPCSHMGSEVVDGRSQSFSLFFFFSKGERNKVVAGLPHWHFFGFLSLTTFLQLCL